MTQTFTTAPVRRLAAVGVAGVTLVALVGCSSSTTSPSASSTVSASGTATSGSTQGSAVPTSSNDPSLLPVPTTPVDAPSAGNINSDAPSATVTTKAPVQISQKATVVPGVQTSLTVKGITATATLPGDVSGPAIQVTVTVVNNGKTAIDTSMMLVTALDAQGVSGVPFTGPPTKRIVSSIAPGKSATGVYALSLPTNGRSKVTVEVSVNPNLATASFVGAVH